MKFTLVGAVMEWLLPLEYFDKSLNQLDLRKWRIWQLCQKHRIITTYHNRRAAMARRNWVWEMQQNGYISEDEATQRGTCR